MFGKTNLTEFKQICPNLIKKGDITYAVNFL